MRELNTMYMLELRVRIVHDAYVGVACEYCTRSIFLSGVCVLYPIYML